MPMKKAAFLILLFAGCSLQGFSQLLVNDLNINDKADVEFIQFTFHIDKKDFKPVYYIDYGMLDQHAPVDKTQIIKVDGVQITNNMSPMLALNRLHKAGWTYLGDMQYIEIPMMDNWYIYTLQRRK